MIGTDYPMSIENCRRTWKGSHLVRRQPSPPRPQPVSLPVSGHCWSRSGTLVLVMGRNDTWPRRPSWRPSHDSLSSR